MAKIKINKLPKGFKLVNGKVVEDKFMRDGGNLSTGDQADYGLVTTPQEYYRNTNFNNTDDKDVRYSLSSVPRENANIEAEGGETVLTDLTNDGTFGLYDIRGPRHSSGGVPMFLPEQSFIYSDTNKMKFTKDELAEFGISTKNKMTPAKLSKKYELNDYYALLESPYADVIQSTTAELMLKKNMMNLSKVAFGQESKKKFEEGVPLAAHPYLVQQGIDPIEFTAKMEKITMQEAQMKALANMPPEQLEQMMMLQQMMSQVDQQGQQGQQQQPMQQPMQQEMAMQEQAMARFGGERRLRKAQRGNETGSEYATRMGQSWPEGVEDPTYDETNEVWVFESGAPSLTKAEAMQMAMAAKNGAPVPEAYRVQSAPTTDESTVEDVDVLAGADLTAEEEIEWRRILEEDPNATIETSVDADGNETITLNRGYEPDVANENTQAENMQYSDTNANTVNIFSDEQLANQQAIADNEAYESVGAGLGLTRPEDQSSAGSGYGSEDMFTDEAQARWMDVWGDVASQIPGFDYNSSDKDMWKQFQTLAESTRKEEYEAAGLPYIPHFDGTDGTKGADGNFGLHTFNAQRLRGKETKAMSAPYIPKVETEECPCGQDAEGNCLECEEPGEIPVVPPREYTPADPEFFLQDLNTLGLNFNDPLYLPWQPDAQQINVNPTFDSWTGAVNANNATAGTIAAALGAVGGVNAVAGSNVQGQAMDENAGAIRSTNKDNVRIANNADLQQNQFDRAINTENDRRNVEVYDNTNKTLQAHNNFNNWKMNERVKAQNNALDNRAWADAENWNHDYFNIDPSSGGLIHKVGSRPFEKTGTQGDRSEAWFNNLAEFQNNTQGMEVTDSMWDSYNNYINGTGSNTNSVPDITQRPGPSARRGRETKIKRMAVPFYTGKMGG